MRTTIGELANSLIEYSNIIEVSNSHEIPFMKVLLGGSSGFAKGYVYIVQTDEHRYSVCDNHDELNGNRMFPSRSKANPFIVEKEIIQMKFGKSDVIFTNEYASVIHNLSVSEFQDHLYVLLNKYKIIKFDTKKLPLHLSREFKNPKIKRIIDLNFSDMKYPNGTLKDFIDIVIKNGKPFNLGNLKARERQEVCSKLQGLGFVLSLDKNVITETKFEKCK